jgi:hypothetical protein
MPPAPGRPLEPPPIPASNGRPLEPLLPPTPPRRSRQQWVDALHDESHGAAAWISGSFSRSFRKSLPNEHDGTLPPLEEPELELEPPELLLDEPPDDELADGLVGGLLGGLLGGGRTDLFSWAGSPPPPVSSDESAQAAAARRIEDEKTRPAKRASFMGVTDHTIDVMSDNQKLPFAHFLRPIRNSGA